MFLASILAFVVVILFYKWINMRPKNFPPGPMPLPLIGSIYNYPSKNIAVCIENWRKVYGDTIGYLFGSKPTVFVTGVNNVLAALRKDEFQGRPYNPFVKSYSNKRLGIGFTEGKHWQESRRFSGKCIREFGKEQTENLMKEEIDELMNSISDNSVIQGDRLFSYPAVNIIWKMIANKRFSMGDKRDRKCLDNVHNIFRLVRLSGDIVTALPILRFVNHSFRAQCAITKQLHSFVRETIDEHKAVLDYNSPRDLIDSYLVEMEEHIKAGTNTIYSEEDLVILCMDLLHAGAEPTSSTTGFLLMYMVLYPEVQKTLQEELDRVLQKSRRPNLDDENQMVYTVAVVSETLRFSLIAPAGVPHRCTCDTTFNNYFIPEDTTIITDLWCLGYSAEYWKEPNKFDPSRFIDENGQLVKYQFFYPFSLGKRSCLGEKTARKSIFLFVASFFQKFSVSLPEGDPLPCIEGEPGITSTPKPFRIKVTNRF